MRLIVIIFSLFIAFSNQTTAQNHVEWLSWEEAMVKMKTEKRKIVIDVYTDWCGWCKKMEKSTFQTKKIADYLNNNYYPVKFDAERKETIIFNDREYKFIKKGRNGYHELAAELLNGKLSFPTVVFLDENAGMIQPIPGFQDAGTFEMIMKFFAEDHFKSISWPQYTREFKPAIPVKISN